MKARANDRPGPRAQADDTAKVRLFDPTRYSPVSTAILQRLPGGNVKAFVIGAALGSWLDLSGSDRRLQSGRDASGTLITSRRLPAILQALGINERAWREFPKDWEARGIAHRCSPGTVFLFAVPLWEECPACHKELLLPPREPPSWRAKRGPGFAAQVVPDERQNLLRTRGTGSAEAPAQVVPRFEPKPATPDLRGVTGSKRGEEAWAEDPAVDVGSEGSLEGLKKIAPLIVKVRGKPCGRCERYGPGHRGDHIAGWGADG
jgi:hypothetical protein